jgi:flavin-dependent dehydrogenase
MDDAAYDAVVVGGRVAGSTTAALLGMRGVRVLLVERIAFPRSTISTHFFRGAGLVAVLERLGILERVLALGPPRLTREFSYGFAEDTGEGDRPGRR